MNRRGSRAAERLYALAHGLFWIPCPLCGEEFGGHEWQPGNQLPTGPHSHQAVCPGCGDWLRGQAAAMCAETGHQEVREWDVVAIERRPGTVELLIDTGRPPDRVRCLSCHQDLTP